MRSPISRFTSAEGRRAFDAAYADGLRELPVPAEARAVATAFGEVRAYRFGEAGGTPLVLLPGRGGTVVSWTPNLAGLAAGRPVIALDPLGEAG
ncbi:hypothetical protein ACSNOI_23535 [Actinomadura kijaniata]|uniref:hypothetical protein n=1 Tax=Actinomadura kijaniata TaxID=46161 RepID=UPI003F19C162